MKIIHITASYKPAYIYGGPIQSVAKLCEALKRLAGKQPSDNRTDIQVLSTTANGTAELAVSTGRPVIVDGVPVTYFKRLTKDHSHFSPALLLNLRKEIRNSTPDDQLIIHIHAWWNLVSVLSCLVAKWYKVPVVLSPRGMLTTYTQNNRNSRAKNLMHRTIGKKLLQYCHIHATSGQEKQDIIKIVEPKSITVIPNLVNIQEPVGRSKQMVRYKHVFELIFLSRIEEKKGLELLFEALSILNIDWHLTIAGTGTKSYVDTLKLKADNLKIAERINWVGQIGNEDKYNLMATHDLLVLTSFNENFANVIIESLSVGTPVLLSDQVGLSDYVNAQQLGWVSTLTADNINENLLNAYSDSQKRGKIRDLAPEIIKKDFNDEILAHRYIQLYQASV